MSRPAMMRASSRRCPRSRRRLRSLPPVPSVARIRPHALARRRYDAPPTLRSAQLEGVVGAEKTHARAEEAARRLGDAFLRVQAALTDLEALTKELARVDGRRRGR